MSDSHPAWPPGLLVVGAAIGALAAGLQGQDAGFDLRNYHWYAAWALLHGRFALDVAPGQLQSFFNPLIELPYYVALSALGGAAGTVVIGALHGILVGLAGVLARQLRLDLPVTAAVMASAAWAPVFLDEVGTSKGDLFVAVLVLAGMWALLRDRGLLAGALTGAAVGLKITAGPFAVALLVAAFVGRCLPRRVLGGLVAGWGLTGAWWAVFLLLQTGNPVFPMANHIFASPWAEALHFAEMGYFPTGHGWLTLPWSMASGGTASWRVEWRDARWLVLGLVGLAWLVRRRDRGEAGLLLAWGGAAWVLWELASSLVRYLAPLEALAGLLIAVLLRDLAGDRSRWLTLSVLAVLALWMRPPAPDRVEFADDLFGVAVPDLPPGPAPVVITAGEGALAYLATAFPSSVRHLRVSSSVIWHGDDTVLNQRIREALSTADPLLLLTGEDGAYEQAALPAYGLSPPGPCRPVPSRLDAGLRLCLLEPLVDR